jgi:hypothetical protein
MATNYLTRSAVVLAVLVAAFPALAAPKTCVIVVADDRPSSAEIFRHELAHCNGWEHADQHHGMFGPKKGYQSPKPPAEFVKPYPNLESHWVSTKEAMKLCGSYGCQWFQ